MRLRSILIPLGVLINSSTAIDLVEYGNPWCLLPAGGQWNAILKSFDSPDQVPRYVQGYIDPFIELQAASRNAELSPVVIRNSVLVAIELCVKATRSFTLSEVELTRRDRDIFRRSLEAATAVFGTEEGKQLAPVFTPQVLHDFMFQRLDDMLVVSKKPHELKGELQAFHKLLLQWRVYVDRLDPDRVRELIDRSIDLPYIKVYSTALLQSNVGPHVEPDVSGLFKHLHAFGNSAQSSMASAVIPALIAIALSVISTLV